MNEFEVLGQTFEAWRSLVAFEVLWGVHDDSLDGLERGDDNVRMET